MHMKKIEMVNNNNSVLFSLPYADIFFFRGIWFELQFWRKCACVNKIPTEQYLWTRCQSFVPNDFSRDFGPVIAFVS